MSYIKKFRTLTFILITSYIAILLVLYITNSVKTIKTATISDVEKQILEMNNSVESWISKEIGVIEATAENIESNKSLNVNELKNYVATIKSSLPDCNISSLYIGTTDNVLLESSGYVPPSDYDLRTREWYISASQSDDVQISSPYIDTVTGKTVIAVSKKITRNNQLFGVLGADIILDDALTPFMQSTNINGYYFCLLDKNMDIIYHPSKDITEDIKNTYISAINNKKTSIKDYMIITTKA